jgi:glycosyltransferase involved in cell wall biosynthesis
MGYVPDLADVYRSAAVAVAPLRFGAGVKGKVCEAMAAGIPVITTPIGAEGLDVEAETEIVIASDPSEFADGLVRLLERPDWARQVGEAGRKKILTLCGEPQARKVIAELIDSLPAVAPAPKQADVVSWAAYSVARMVPAFRALRIRSGLGRRQ